MIRDISSPIRLKLLGPPQIVRADGTEIALRSRKHLALLVYLAMEQRHASSRDTLTALLWPDVPEDSARNNLRVILANLRRDLGEATVPLFHATRLTIQLTHASDSLSDVHAFRALLDASKQHPHTSLSRCASCLNQLEQAVALYRGEFLQGFSLPESGVFEEWALIQREHLHQAALEALATLAAACEQRGDHAAQCRYARRQIELEPWREQAHAQLMRGLWASGQRAAALEQYDTCCRILQAELGLGPSAELTTLVDQLRASDRPVGIETRAQPAASRPAIAHDTLPVPLAPFVGRATELAELTDLLHSHGVRLLTLVGIGGMGKTHLAIELARRNSDRFADGVCFVPLAPLASASELPAALLHALALSPPAGDPMALLRQTLRDRHMLLVLDNFEHLLDGAPLVAEVLQAAPGVQVLATSRERLGVRGEQRYQIQGLAFDPAASDLDAQALPAVTLFVQNARRMQPHFRLSPGDLADVLQICRSMFGMPLGLELAAAWVALLPLSTIAAQLQRGSDFLATELRDIPARQRSMRAVFDWSWQLLSLEERRVFRQLTVFRGGFTLDAALTVAQATLPAILRLVEHSLVQVGTGRYEVHELLRQFAAERLAADAEEHAAVEARHSAFYLHYAAQREQRITHDQPREATAEIRAEIDNIGHAWQWAARHAQIDLLEHSAPAVWFFVLSTGLYAAGEQWFGAAVAALQNGTRAPHLVADDPQRYERVLSTLLGYRARVFTALGTFEQAVVPAQQAIDLGEANGGTEGQALGHLVLGQTLSRQEQALAAQPHILHAVDLAHSNSHQHQQRAVFQDIEWVGHIWLGVIAKQLDNLAETEAHFAQSLQLCQRSGNLRGEMTSLENLGSLDLARGNYRRARHLLEQSLNLAQRVGYRWGEAVTRLELGDALRFLGEYGPARDLIEQAIAIFHEIGDIYQECFALSHCGRLYSFAGDYTHAWLHLERALQLIGDTGSLEVEADTCVSLTLFSLFNGDAPQALSYAERGWDVACSMSSAAWQATAQLVMGHALADLSRFAEAATAYGRALDLFTEIGNQPVAAEARAGLALVALAAGDGTAARAQIETILPLLDGAAAIGLDEPFSAYLACFRVLQACGDPRAAAIVQAANKRLDAYAGSIADPALRTSFRETVPSHRALRDAKRSSHAQAFDADTCH